MKTDEEVRPLDEARRALIEHFTGNPDEEYDGPCSAIDALIASVRAEQAAVDDLLEAVAAIERLGAGTQYVELNTRNELWDRFTDAAARVRSLREGNKEQ